MTSVKYYHTTIPAHLVYMKSERRRCTSITYNGVLLSLKAPVKVLSTVLGKSNLQFSGMNIKLTVSTCSLILMNLDNQQVR